jgi:hydroxymethylbilane synthase
VIVETTGDRRPDVSLDRIGGQGIFAKEVQRAVLEDRADIAVHSAKDLPSDTPAGLTLAAVPRRGDPRDAMLGRTLGDLAPGAVVATGSVRRRAQLAHLRPDLTFVDLRGNMATRVARVDDGRVSAVVVAAAAMARLGWTERITELLSPSVVLPQAGQGALALECRSDDRSALALLALIDDPEAHRGLRAERRFAASVGGGCDLPFGALARPVDGGPGALELVGMMASGDGRIVVRASARGTDPEGVADTVLHRLATEHGSAVLDVDPVGAPVGDPRS